jgi:hypothetical protein
MANVLGESEGLAAGDECAGLGLVSALPTAVAVAPDVAEDYFFVFKAQSGCGPNRRTPIDHVCYPELSATVFGPTTGVSAPMYDVPRKEVLPKLPCTQPVL